MKIFSSLLVVILFCGCTGPQRVSVEKFHRVYANVGQPDSTRSFHYLGQQNDCAFVHFRYSPIIRGVLFGSHDWKDRVYYVRLSELHPRFRDSLPKTETKTIR
jgi:hypothetical protein